MYLGNACPWCHRVLLTLILRGLLPGVMVVNAADDPERASRGGWVFDSPDPVFGAADLRRALRLCITSALQHASTSGCYQVASHCSSRKPGCKLRFMHLLLLLMFCDSADATMAR